MPRTFDVPSALLTHCLRHRHAVRTLDVPSALDAALDALNALSAASPCPPSPPSTRRMHLPSAFSRPRLLYAAPARRIEPPLVASRPAGPRSSPLAPSCARSRYVARARAVSCLCRRQSFV
ncbi:hypothetical protein DENSPDRAFT_886203 [Dentipellis sp. KUC8613]|nr:hypothetical protein DENSPDRAFT_886203 [Dentipellis sp. KUC8613]